MIGRDKETAELERTIGQQSCNQGFAVLLSGEAGIGKTTLAERTLARRPSLVFRSRAMAGSMPAYGLIADALRDAIRQQKAPVLDAGPYSLYLRYILRELGPPPETTDAQLLLEALLSALGTLNAGQPAILFLDDLQWADNASLELLPVLAERWSEGSLLILGAYRSDGLSQGHRLRWVRSELRRRKLLVEIALEPFSQEETACLVEQILGDRVSPALAQMIHAQSQGVPLFIEELCLALKTQNLVRPGPEGMVLLPGEPVPVPESIRDLVLPPLENLPETERAQLETAAVAGNEFDLEMIAALAGDEAAPDTVLTHPLVVEVRDGRAAFRNELIREAVLSSIPWSRRRRLHRRFADYLQSRNATPERLAEHWLAAGDTARARDSLIAAAEFSCNLHAYRDAAQATHRALEIWPEGEDEDRRLKALERLGQCAKVSGQLQDAARTFREIVASPVVRQDTPRLAEAYRGLATVYGLQNAWKPYFESRQKAAEAFEAAGMPGEAATEWLGAATRSTGLYDLEPALEMCDRAIQLARRAERSDLEARALGLKGNVLSMSGKHQEGIESANTALSLALGKKAIDAAAEVYRRMGTTLEYASEYASSRNTYLTAYDFCKREGELAQAQLCLSCMSWVLFRTGDWKRCIEVCREVMDDPGARPTPKALVGCVLGLVEAYRGETRPARRHLESAFQAAVREESALAEMIARWGLARLEEFGGRFDQVPPHYLRILEIRAQLEDTHDCLTALFSGVGFFAGQKAEPEAAMLVDALSTIAARTGNLEALAMLSYALGELAFLHGDADEAVRQMEQSLSQMEKLSVPIEQSWVEARLGLALTGTGDRQPGIGHLRQAYRRFRNLGARPLASAVAETLKGLGESPEEARDPEAETRVLQAGLTQRQLEVARLIAEGLTNKEIAEKLFLSPRTVEMHVAHLLNRLDCRNRSEAVHKAARLGLL